MKKGLVLFCLAFFLSCSVVRAESNDSDITQKETNEENADVDMPFAIVEER